MNEESELTPKKDPKPTVEELAREIADDVQQTYEGVSNQYRTILEKRINDLLSDQRKQIHSDVKRIMSHNFGKERNKKRIMDPEKNQAMMNHLGGAFTVIESEVKDDLKEYLIDGKDIFSIVPKRDFEKDEEVITEDKPAE